MPAFNKTFPIKNGRISVQFNSDAKEEPVTIQIYEDIGEDPWMGSGFTAKDFSDALSDVPRNKPIDIRINSAGGNVWDGMAIKTLLDEWPAKKTASIDGMAASVASWIPMCCDEIRAPKHAQMFIHDAWGFAMGNAEDMRDTAENLDKTSQQIADIYARKTGMSSTECRSLMQANTLMTAEQAHEKGFIDRLTDEEPVANFTDKQISNMKSKLEVLRNSLSAPQGGANQKQGKEKTIVNKEQKLALLNKWGVTVPENATDEQLDALIEAGKPKAKNAKSKTAKAPKSAIYKHGEEGEGDDDNDGDQDGEGNEDDMHNSDDGDGDEGKGSFNAATRRAMNAAKQAEQLANSMRAEARKNLKVNVANRIKQAVEADKIPANQMDDWTEDAMAAYDRGDDYEKILNRLEALPARAPGAAPLNISVGESTSVEDLNRYYNSLMAPINHLMRNRSRGSDEDRKIVGLNSKAMSALMNRLKKISFENSAFPGGEMTGPLRQMWDAWASGNPSAPRNANTMDAGLLRQVILSEVMRAFRRRLVALSFFAHTFQNVPLEGTDVVRVPYYPLDTVASSDFVQANGYQINPNAQTLSKSITVGGSGVGAKAAGIGRKYKGLQFSAYEIRRQPWLDIQKLTVMAGEQLAIDVLSDIIAAWINAANFGNAVFSGPAAAFNANVVATQLQVAANRADWPEPMRNMVLDTAYYANLVSDPDVKAFLNYGDTGPIREAKLAGLYGFENTIQNPRIPQTGDASLIGWMSWPSAILVATAPIMPAPGEMLRLVSYETVVDDQTGLSFSYKYWGDPMFSTDYEIIECCYGSGLGELAALKRLVSAGV